MTHLEFFHLAEEPFSNLPDARFFFSCAEHAPVIELCMMALTRTPSCALITSDAGMGKTLLAHKLADMLPRETWRACHLIVPNAALTPRELLRRLHALLSDEGTPLSSEDSFEELFSRTTHQLETLSKEGKQPLLIVDEAQILELPETIALLGKLCVRKAEGLPHLALFLFGLSGCEARLVPGLGLEQYSGHPVIHGLSPLSPATVSTYIQHRMTLAGATTQPFAPETLDVIHHLSGGIPRRINVLCDAALFEAARLGRTRIEPTSIEHLSARIESDAQDWASPGQATGTSLTAEKLGEIDHFLEKLLEG